MKTAGRTNRVVLTVAVAVAASSLEGCMHMAYIGAAGGGYDETHSRVVATKNLTPSRSEELSPALPSPSEAVEVPPEKTDIPITSEVVISVAPSRLKEAPRPRRFLDGR
jgi:hypothetical protein